MKKLLIIFVFAMLLGMAACSSASPDTDSALPSPPAAAETPVPVPTDGAGEAQPAVLPPYGGEETAPGADGEDAESEDGTDAVSSPAPYQPPAPSVPPVSAEAPAEPDGAEGEEAGAEIAGENGEGSDADEADGQEGSSSGRLSGSYWSASLYTHRSYDGTEYTVTGKTTLPPEEETVNLLLCEGGEGLFRCSLWGPEDPDNGYLRWEASHHGGTELLKIDLASGFTLYGSASDDIMTLDYREGELTLVKLDYGPAGFELRPELLDGSWALESAEEGGDIYDPVEPGTRAYLSVNDGRADLYWYDGLLSFRSYSAEGLDAGLSWQPLYFGCGNECWSAELSGGSDRHKAFSVTALSPDRLEMLVSTYSGTDPYPSVLCLYFSRVSSGETDRAGEPSAVTVSCTDELIHALHDGATVTLKSGEYDITPRLDEYSLPGWGYIGDNSGSRGLFAGHSSDGIELVIAGMNGITLRSEDPSDPARIVCSSPDANVLSFYGCSGISLENLVLTHSGAAQSSTGSVVTAEYCAGLSITGCELFGSGAYALECYDCPGLYISSGRIHDCLYGCAVLSSCSSAEIRDTAFYGCSGPSALELDGSDAVFSSCFFRGLGDSPISYDGGSDIRFENCEFDSAGPEPSGTDSPAFGGEEDEASSEADEN